MPETILTLNVDNEFKSLIPPLSDDEYQRLERSILAEGVRDSIITWNGTIVDGHNRYRICQEHGVAFRTTEREFTSREAAKIWIINNQFARRNLSKYDRSVLALQLESLVAAEAQRRMTSTLRRGSEVPASQKSDEREHMRTDEQLAKLAGVSRDTIRKVKVIETEAESGNETAIEAREAVRSGSSSIHAAYTEVRPKGDQSDVRPICTVCGEPIDDGDSYGHNQFKHKSCAIVDTEVHRGTRGGRKPTRQYRQAQFAADGRRICALCGEPIDDGDHYQDKPNWHYKCGLEHATSVQREYRDADRALRENVPTYTTESLVAELAASVNDMSDAMAESIAINESMGVRLTSAQKNRIDKAINALEKAVKAIGR